MAVVDAQAVIRAMTAGRPEVAAVAGDRVWAETELPEVYEIEDGPAVLLNVRGGEVSYSDSILNVSVQVQCYGQTQRDAWRMFQALYDGLHGRSGAQVKRVRMDVMGQLVREPDTQFYFVISFWTFWLQALKGRP